MIPISNGRPTLEERIAPTLALSLAPLTIRMKGQNAQITGVTRLLEGTTSVSRIGAANPVTTATAAETMTVQTMVVAAGIPQETGKILTATAVRGTSLEIVVTGLETVEGTTTG